MPWELIHTLTAQILLLFIKYQKNDNKKNIIIPNVDLPNVGYNMSPLDKTINCLKHNINRKIYFNRPKYADLRLKLFTLEIF
jgi:hypothetical protein